jgi:hypothetical protein
VGSLEHYPLQSKCQLQKERGGELDSHLKEDWREALRTDVANPMSFAIVTHLFFFSHIRNPIRLDNYFSSHN